MTTTAMTALLQTALSLLTIVTTTPNISPAQQAQAIKTAQQAIELVATQQNQSLSQNSGGTTMTRVPSHVDGMTQYSDSTGLTFWYPSNWVVTTDEWMNEHRVSVTTPYHTTIYLGIPPYNSGLGLNSYKDGHRTTTNFSYSTSSKAWYAFNGKIESEAQYWANAIPIVSTSSERTMYNLPLFRVDEGKVSSVVIPWNPGYILLIYCNNYVSSSLDLDVGYFAKTIGNTGVSAQPLSSVQLSLIEAERDAYSGKSGLR